MEVLLNDALVGLPDTTLTLIDAPNSGNLELLEDVFRFRYTAEEDFRGKIIFRYQVCSPATVCNLPCATATVTIDVQNLPVVPEGLVVNDPGLNGRLTIKGINGFARVEITITDRWGDLVFQEKSYNNADPWTGYYMRNGKQLPQGAYYYYLKAFDGTGQVGETVTGVVHLFEK
jgi:gliding motility-associated-like protein